MSEYGGADKRKGGKGNERVVTDTGERRDNG